ncbi:hypothetical protein ALC57_13335 [Trachymyrmex cornetzi]|uniref:DUF4218 domain-containing protein n=1 Tax=Trachymyrmex cornetzi TaxID=471704 RepID=A0A151IZH5_9HYME|nr:hypothetical protein ALC57_13335 [Trachymyrmex cornetzi]
MLVPKIRNFEACNPISPLNQNALTSLLRVLSRHGHDDLSRDARTLLNTPRPGTHDIKTLSKGQYVHYGLLKALISIGNRFPHAFDYCDVINLDLNIDGLPISKSSKSQLWPILGRISDNFIPIFCLFLIYTCSDHDSFLSPNLAEFLQPFVDEYLNLKNNEFSINEHPLQINIRAVICDAPARAYITCTKSHNGHFACGKCTVRGESINRRMTFLDIAAPLRTDIDFINRSQPEHHLQGISSPFELISVPMVSHFPIDYMHNTCLGVNKQLLKLRIDRSKTSGVALVHLNILSNALTNVSKCIPTEFALKSFDLDDYHRWKATQHRTFLLYLGPLVLRHILPDEKYIHFNALNCAMRIVCSIDDYDRNNGYAHDLLVYFVQNMSILYGSQNVTYNMHNLIHLAADVKRLGPLDSFSVFPFEHFLFILKKLLRKFDKPLQQICNRLHEQSSLFRTENERFYDHQYPQLQKKINQNLPLGCCNTHNQIKFSSFVLTAKKYNNCCYIKENNAVSIVCISHIGYYREIPTIIDQKFMNISTLPNYPCNSGNLGIYVVTGLSALQMWPVSLIKNKAFQMDFGKNST